MIESSSILAYNTSAKLGDGSWIGSNESFITNWQNQVHLYEKHVPTTDHFSDGQSGYVSKFRTWHKQAPQEYC
jgi:hypothetical protein